MGVVYSGIDDEILISIRRCRLVPRHDQKLEAVITTANVEGLSSAPSRINRVALCLLVFENNRILEDRLSFLSTGVPLISKLGVTCVHHAGPGKLHCPHTGQYQHSVTHHEHINESYPSYHQYQCMVGYK